MLAYVLSDVEHKERHPGSTVSNRLILPCRLFGIPCCASHQEDGKLISTDRCGNCRIQPITQSNTHQYAGIPCPMEATIDTESTRSLGRRDQGRVGLDTLRKNGRIIG